jgi:hypothetical protein
MRRVLRLAGVVLAVLAGVAAAPQSTTPATAVKVGQSAPAFTLPYLAPAPDGTYSQKTMSLADFKGKKTVILAFYPAAFSPG